MESSPTTDSPTAEASAISRPDPSICGADVAPDGWVCAPPGRFELGAGGCYGDPEAEFATGVFVALTKPLWVAERPVSGSEWYDLMEEYTDERFPEDANDEPYGSVSYGAALLYANRLSLEHGLVPCYDLDVAPECRRVYYDELWSDFDCGPGAMPRYEQECTGYRLPTIAENEWILRAAGTYGWPDMSVCLNHPWFGRSCLPGVSLWVYDRTSASAPEWGTIDYFPAAEYQDPVLHEVLDASDGLPLAWLGQRQRNVCADMSALSTVVTQLNAGLRLVRTATEGASLSDGPSP
ncbi:MAG: hypothetical protein ACI81R_003641 [Bradymonadia bacterium]